MSIVYLKFLEFIKFSVFLPTKIAKNFDKWGWWNRTRHKDSIRLFEKKVRLCWKKVLGNFNETAQSLNKVLLFFNFPNYKNAGSITFFSSKKVKKSRLFYFWRKKTWFLTSRECDIFNHRRARLILSENWSRKMRNILTKSAGFEIEWGDKCSKYLECSG